MNEDGFGDFLNEYLDPLYGEKVSRPQRVAQAEETAGAPLATVTDLAAWKRKRKSEVSGRCEKCGRHAVWCRYGCVEGS